MYTLERISAVFLLTLSFPYIAFAQANDFKGLVDIFLEVIGALIPLVFGLAFIVFIWGIVQAWILGGGNVESVNKGKNIALVGIIVFVVMLGIWGILGLLRATFFGG